MAQIAKMAKMAKLPKLSIKQDWSNGPKNQEWPE